MSAVTSQTPNAPMSVVPRHTPVPSSPKSLLTIALLLGCAVFMGLIVRRGLETGVTKFSGRYGASFSAKRQTEPVLFLFCIGVESVIGIACLGAAVWRFKVTCLTRK